MVVYSLEIEEKNKIFINIIIYLYIYIYMIRYFVQKLQWDMATSDGVIDEI